MVTRRSAGRTRAAECVAPPLTGQPGFTTTAVSFNWARPWTTSARTSCASVRVTCEPCRTWRTRDAPTAETGRWAAAGTGTGRSTGGPRVRRAPRGAVTPAAWGASDASAARSPPGWTTLDTPDGRGYCPPQYQRKRGGHGGTPSEVSRPEPGTPAGVFRPLRGVRVGEQPG